MSPADRTLTIPRPLLLLHGALVAHAHMSALIQHRVDGFQTAHRAQLVLIDVIRGGVFVTARVDLRLEGLGRRHELHRGGDAVDVEDGPKRPRRADALVEGVDLVAVDAEVDLAVFRDVVGEDGVLHAHGLEQRPDPVAT